MADIKYTQMFINNEFVNALSGKTFPVINPATGEKFIEVQEGDKADVDKAVHAARQAFACGSAWHKLEPKGRAALIDKLAELVKRDGEILAKLDTLCMGKPISDAIGDSHLAADILHYYAGWVDKLSGKTIPTDSSDFFAYTRREPIGVAGIILPWNFPTLLVALKSAPALAAGCTIVLKPAEQSPLSALHIASLVKEAGFPPGVFNVVTGYGPTAGHGISSHMDIDKVNFTGSTDVGRRVMEAAAKSNLKRVTLELGGKSPLIIFDDADVDIAAQKAHDAIMFNQGQVCCAASRTFVQSGIYDAFVAKSKELAEKRANAVGNPLEPSTVHGPQVDKDQFNKVLEYVELGKKEGARCVAGGAAASDKGYFVAPTVFADTKDDMSIAKDEIFGPVETIFKFDTIEEAVKRANATRYGLAAGVFTKDINKALTVANAFQAGTVWVNCWGNVQLNAPFGGYKESGFGRDWGVEAVYEYLQTKSVIIELAK